MICFLDLGTSKVSGLLTDDLSTSTIHAFSSIETSGVKKGSIINIASDLGIKGPDQRVYDKKMNFFNVRYISFHKDISINVLIYFDLS